MKRRGFSLVETIIYAGFLALIGIGTVTLIGTNNRMYMGTTNQMGADQSASIAIAHMSRDLQEAKQFVINSPTSLTVYYPQKLADGTYNRMVTDNVNTVSFYRSNANFTPNSNGSYLVRSPAGGTRRIICKLVTGLTFASISASSVDVSLETRCDTSSPGTPRSCYMMHRAIFLRNY